MATIEERAEKIAKKNARTYKVYCDYADKEGVCAFVSSTEECKKSAIDSATEQEAIDIEKAYKWIKENVECGIHPQSAYGFADRFLKVMKE